MLRMRWSPEVNRRLRLSSSMVAGSLRRANCNPCCFSPLLPAPLRCDRRSRQAVGRLHRLTRYDVLVARSTLFVEPNPGVDERLGVGAGALAHPGGPGVAAVVRVKSAMPATL